MQVTQTHLDSDMVKAILSEYKIHNADVTLRMDATDEDLIDTIEGNRVYMPCIYVLNKIDQISIEVGKRYSLCQHLFSLIHNGIVFGTNPSGLVENACFICSFSKPD